MTYKTWLYLCCRS